MPDSPSTVERSSSLCSAEKDLIRIAKEPLGKLEQRVGPIGEVTYLSPNKEVDDNPAKLLVRLHTGRPIAVLKFSTPTFPDAVSIEQGMQNEMFQHAGPELRNVFLQPLDQGWTERRSWVLLPYYIPLERTRCLWLNKIRLWRFMTGWLRGVARQTAMTPGEEEIESAFIIPLAKLSQDVRFSEGFRSEAATAAEAVKSGGCRPMVVLAHNDLHRHNILQRSDQQSRAGPFVVIDWGSAQARGCPFLDLTRLARSFGVPRFLLERQVMAHRRILGFDADGAKAMVLAGIARIVMEPRALPVNLRIPNFESTFQWIAKSCGR